MSVSTQPNAQFSFQKSNVDNSCRKTCKIRYYIFEVLANFIVSLLSRIADGFQYMLQLAECVSIFALVGIPIGSTICAAELKICGITSKIKKYLSVIKKKRKKLHKIVLLANTKSNTIEVLLSKALIDSYIVHYKLALVNNALTEYNQMKEKMKKEILWNILFKHG